MEIIIPKGFGVLATIIITVSSFIAGAAWWGATISADVAHVRDKQDADSKTLSRMVRKVDLIGDKLGINDDGLSFNQ